MVAAIDFQDNSGTALALNASGNVPALARQRESVVPPLIPQILSIVRRRMWWIVGIIGAALVAGLILTLLMTPQYTASALLEIQRETSNFVKVDGATQKDNSLDQEFYQTQYGLLQSSTLAERVATDLKLYDNLKILKASGQRMTLFVENGKFLPGEKARQARVRAAGVTLLKRFTLQPERFSRLVKISYTDPDPEMARQVVDSWSQDFIRLTLDRRFEATSYARKFLEGRLSQLRARIDESQRKLVAYAAEQGIINLPSVGSTRDGGTVTPERSLVADDLANLNQELTQATADRIRAQSRLGSPAGVVVEALDNLAITNLRQKRAELSAEYAKMLVQFEPGYPPARALKTQIDQLDGSITREEGRVQRTLRQVYDASTQREAGLRARVDSLKSGMLDLRRRSVQYDIFLRDVDTNQQLYDALLQRYKEIGVAGGVAVNNISIVDPAEVPLKPSSPRILLNLVLALLAGIVVSVAVAFALEQFDQAISDPGEVESTLGVPLLGTLPKVADANPTDALRDRKSSLSEAYLSLQTNLGFSTDHGFPRSLAVTSARASEGKSTTSYALARSLARTGVQVLLIDGDMRSPSVNSLFGMDNARGLSNFLAGDGQLADLVRETPFADLFAMTAGPQPPSAPELLGSERFGILIKTALETFDHVIFDIPPVMGLADAPLIASQVEGVIFVIEARSTHKAVARVALGRLAAARARIFGVVLSKFDARRAYYGYGYDYGYGYGDTDEGNATKRELV